MKQRTLISLYIAHTSVPNSAGFYKGQLISKCLFEVFVWTKIPTKSLIISALKGPGQKLSKFSLVFWSKRWFHKDILKLIDLYLVVWVTSNSNLRVVICLFVTNGGKSFIIHDLLDLKFSYRIESKQDGGLPISTVEWGHSLEHFSKINLIFRRGRKIIRSLVLQRKWWFWRLWSQEDS